MVVYIQMIDTVVDDASYQCVFVRGIYIVIRNGEELLVVRLEIPDVRQRSVHRSANRDRVAEDVGLMNGEVQYNRTVATMEGRHRDLVDTGFAELHWNDNLVVKAAAKGDVSALGYDIGIGYDAMMQAKHNRFFVGEIDYIRYYGL